MILLGGGPALSIALATTKPGHIDAIAMDRRDRPRWWGAVCLGVVDRAMPSLEAAFLRLPQGETGLLKLADTRPRGLPASGTAVRVQIAAMPDDGKAWPVTMEPSFGGRWLVRVPGSGTVALSRRAGADEAASVRRLLAPFGAGWIIRNAALGAHPDALAAEAARLDALARAAADIDTADALLEGPDALARAQAELRADAPVWPERPGHDAFDDAGLWEAIAALAVPEVKLPGGARLTLEQTRLGTTIDVDAGERLKPMEANLAAMPEVARQLRLRNLGGIALVDPVGLRSPAAKAKIVAALDAALADDPAGAQLHGMTKLGLIEITRRRRGPAHSALLRWAGLA